MDKDYELFDYFSVSVKSAHADEIKECYRALGWSEVKSEDDKDFIDMKYVLYSRPRDVKNKDRLQFLQVRMENALNSISERWVKRYSKSTALAVFLGLLGCALVGVSVWIFLALSRETYLWLAILTGSLGACSFTALIYPFVFERKKEEEEFRKKSRESLNLLKSLIREAEALSGEDGNDKKSFVFAEESLTGSVNEPRVAADKESAENIGGEGEDDGKQ